MNIKDPQSLSREEYWEAYADFLYLRRVDRTFYKGILAEIVNEMFGNSDIEL